MDHSGAIKKKKKSSKNIFIAKKYFILIKISYILELVIRHNKKIIPEISDKEIRYIHFNCPKIKRILLSD